MPRSLISELEDAIRGSSSTKRIETLRRVTDLLLMDAERLSESQVALFDDVMTRLMQLIESKALAELSVRLAPVDNAPQQVIRQLAHNDEIAVAGPVLTQSKRIDVTDLVEIARTKGQAHLLAISGRAEIEEVVTDVLVDRGNRDVVRRLARNAGAALSHPGLTALAKRAENDETLLESLGSRPDIPIPVFRELLLRATDAAKARLLASAPPERRVEVRLALKKAAGDVDRAAGIGRNREEAQCRIRQMHEKGLLDAKTIVEFAYADKFDEVTVATAILSGIPCELFDQLMLSERSDALLIPFRAAGLNWSAVRAILQMRSFRQAMSGQDMDQLKADFAKLSLPTAQRVLRFWQVRHASSGPAAAPAQLAAPPQ